METEDNNAKKLLQELGLFDGNSVSSIEDRVNNLNMRQLDRLKLMLIRSDKGKNIFSDEIRLGIRNNNFRAFAEAVKELSIRLK